MGAARRIGVYAAYAPIYHAIGQGAFAQALVGHVLAELPAPPRRALDLACGAGAASLALAAAGARVVGVDRSPQMLAIAEALARDAGLAASFIEADLRALPVAGAGAQEATDDGGADHPVPRLLRPASFDLITCLYDSMNYLTGDGELAAVIASAARLLAPGGRMVFDLNTDQEFSTWDEVDQVIFDDGATLVYNRLSYDPQRRLARGRIVWLVRDDAGTWWRDEEQHIERAWGDAEVLAALGAAGLRLVERRTPEWAPAGPRAPRVVYEARK